MIQWPGESKYGKLWLGLEFKAGCSPNTWLRGYGGLGKQGSRATGSGLSKVSLPDVGFRRATLRGAFPLASSVWWILAEVCLAWCCRVASGAGSLRQERWPPAMPTVEGGGLSRWQPLQGDEAREGAPDPAPSLQEAAPGDPHRNSVGTCFETTSWISSSEASRDSGHDDLEIKEA